MGTVSSEGHALGQESGSVTDVAEEKPKESVKEPDGEREYITGVRLLAVISSITVVGFLMLLDMSIIATVSQHPPKIEGKRTVAETASRPSLKSRRSFSR